MAVLGLRFLSNNTKFEMKIGAGGEECGACKSLNLEALRRTFVFSFVAFPKSRSCKSPITMEGMNGEKSQQLWDVATVGA